MRRYYLDNEFDEKPNEINLISVALVDENDREYYAVSSEFDPAACNPWVQEHVLPRIAGEPRKPVAMIRQEILDFIGEDEPEFWGYYCDYDWVVFCWIFGSMADLPAHFPIWCRDLQQVLTVTGIPRIPDDPDEHHALVDARWNKQLHEYIREQQQTLTRIVLEDDHPVITLEVLAETLDVDLPTGILPIQSVEFYKLIAGRLLQGYYPGASLRRLS